MSALPPNRTWISRAVMSALCQKRTHALQQKGMLFDHLVGELQEGFGDAKPKRFCGFEVDDKLKLDWRLCGEIGRVLALQDTIDIRGCPSKNIDGIGPIRHQPPLPKRSAERRIPQSSEQ